MWCIPELTDEFKEKMEDVLLCYEKPYDPAEPVVCLDEKSKQLLADKRKRLPLGVGKPARYDYQYERNGTRNLFVAVEPRAGYRSVKVTRRRTKKDFAYEVKRLLKGHYRSCRRLHLVVDNLNTHFEKSFYETFPKTEAEGLLKRLKFHYTPTHASWLNMAEVEISILSRQCTKRRIPTESLLKSVVSSWQRRRNQQKATIQWKFSRKDARKIFKY